MYRSVFYRKKCSLKNKTQDEYSINVEPLDPTAH